MELNFSELDSLNTNNQYDNFNYNSYEQNSMNYWDKQNKDLDVKTKKKKVSFDDILSNMNLVVNNQGVLQHLLPIQKNEEPMPQYNQQQLKLNNNIRQIHYGPNQIPVNLNKEPLIPEIKHSYIYNKYFKDYTDPNVEKKGPRVPKTVEELNQMLLDDKIKEIQHKKRMAQIKSKKMLFVSAPGAHYNPRNIHATKNNLRSMNFS
jgi:hypothetical protein